MQTIKNTELEYIKEIGSGMYGTVYYGKWKGSAVAIKKIKPSCFTEDSLGEDRLVVTQIFTTHFLC
jgi:predicted Ser/Thr protein kinase